MNLPGCHVALRTRKAPWLWLWLWLLIVALLCLLPSMASCSCDPKLPKGYIICDNGAGQFANQLISLKRCIRLAQWLNRTLVLSDVTHFKRANPDKNPVQVEGYHDYLSLSDLERLENLDVVAFGPFLRLKENSIATVVSKENHESLAKLKEHGFTIVVKMRQLVEGVTAEDLSHAKVFHNLDHTSNRAAIIRYYDDVCEDEVIVVGTLSLQVRFTAEDERVMQRHILPAYIIRNEGDNFMKKYIRRPFLAIHSRNLDGQCGRRARSVRDGSCCQSSAGYVINRATEQFGKLATDWRRLSDGRNSDGHSSDGRGGMDGTSASREATDIAVFDLPQGEGTEAEGTEAVGTEAVGTEAVAVAAEIDAARREEVAVKAEFDLMREEEAEEEAFGRLESGARLTDDNDNDDDFCDLEEIEGMTNAPDRTYPFASIFLLSDHQKKADDAVFLDTYGATRYNGSVARTSYYAGALIDAYIASQADYFIGQGLSTFTAEILKTRAYAYGWKPETQGTLCRKFHGLSGDLIHALPPPYADVIELEWRAE
eukprot:TRINITY_DN1109_c0_g1_i4.p1 TRINITY_DN1109_c0_g1~~TRINITY_DN1109_c0_g1_i4.p1  ORF type:complete len:541 (+),score=79.38 TRINITY_DN1109_c0_g1_i4:100-1722(+)